MRKEVNGCRRWKQVRVAAGLMLTLCSAPATSAQDNSDRQIVPVEIRMNELLRGHGELLAEGSNAVPIGPLGLKTYRLEEVRLPEPLEQHVGGRRQRIESVFRLTVTGESFSGNHTIWINDEPVPDPMSGRTELIAIIFNHAVLEDGASISVSHGAASRESGNPDARTTLPERLRLPAQMRRERPSADTNRNTVRLRRIASSPALREQPGVEVELTADVPFPILNAFLIVQIGDQEFGCGHRPNSDRRTVVCHLSEEEFARLRDGDPIRAKYGRGLAVPSFQRFGHLNKSLLDR